MADFSVLAGHDYAQAGTYTRDHHVVGADGLPTVTSTQATVTAATPPIERDPGDSPGNHHPVIPTHSNPSPRPSPIA